MNPFWIILSCIALGGLGVSVFLWGKLRGTSLFDRLYSVFFVYFPQLVKAALEKCCGKRAPAALDDGWQYVFFTRNPIVQVAYIFLFVGGFLSFVYVGFPYIPSKHLGWYHKWGGYTIFTVAFVVWFKARSTNPGIVTKSNVSQLCELFEFDKLLFSSSTCRTCGTVKPARSKHCALCGFCVARFDHHCVWINNCVGLGNHKWFLGFLFWHLLFCAYGVFLGSTIIYGYTLDSGLFSAVFVDPATHERFPATYAIVFRYLLTMMSTLVFLTIHSGVMGIVFFGFFMWHLNLVRMGTTMNELSKWRQVKRWRKMEELKNREGMDKLKPLRNIYDLGLFGNFKEVLFNVDVRGLTVPLSGKTSDGKAKVG